MTRSAPCSSGRYRTGVTNVLSMTSFAPPARAISARAGTSGTRHIGSVASFGTFGAILGCVAAGMGVAILPKRITTEHVARKELRTHAFDDLDDVTTYLVTPEEAPVLPELDALRAVLGRQAGALLAR